MQTDILADLNPQQLEAVTAPDGPILVIAGAGSGKTRVITRRIAYLVREGLASPHQIFAATFTNKAADEMKHRVAQLSASTMPRDYHIATFHSLCARILRREASAINLSRSFTICDEHDQFSAVKHVMKQLGITDKQAKPADAHYVIGQCKMRMLGPDGVGEVARSNLEELYADIYKAYDAYLRANSAVDFEDLILLCVRLFEQHPAILQQYQHWYRYVMVDEYQDTNMVQFELVRLLAGAHRNLMVVGDEDQSIYSWRGADISNLLDFQEHFPEARLIRLELNYRSTGTILKAAHAVIENNRQRLGKNLVTEKGEGAPVFICAGHTEAEEAVAVAEAIQALVGSGGQRYSDIGIFYRIAALSRIFEDRMRQYGIPYRVVGGVRFYDRAEIKDMLAYLQACENPGNSMALLRIVNTPKRGLGARSVQAVIDEARRRNTSEYEVMLNAGKGGVLGAKAAEGAARLARQLRDWHQFSRDNKISQLLERILTETQYTDNLGDPDSLEVRARCENIEELLNSIAQFEKENPLARLGDYLENVSLVNSTDERTEKGPCVSLMTLHAAKGLEFRTVFIVGLEDGIFPNARAMRENPDDEEERRLFYVGITRARENLVLTRSESRVLYGEIRNNRRSQFLGEIPRELLAPLNLKRLCQPADGQSATPPDTAHGALDDVLPPEPILAGPASRPPGADYDLGCRVRHPLLGEGMVTGVTGTGRRMALLIQTDDGQTHKLLAAYAKLERLD